MGRNSWIAGLAAVAASAALLSTPAQADASIYVQIAPPAPRYEVVPAPRVGHTWVAGHWQWNGRRHVWVPGVYVATRAGYVYEQPRWVRTGNRWGYYSGGWQHGPVRHPGARGRDRDRDGIPDRRDRDLDNDGRPNHRDFDRDGDGVANHRDRAPDNRYRR